jgi:hypothetical protein
VPRRRLTSVVPGAGFSATGDGTVTVQGTGNTIFGNGSGAALNVANTTIGASGLTFQSISAGAASGSAGNGITLDNTGASGGLTVTGTGTAGHAAAFAATASVSMASSDTLGKDDLRSSVIAAPKRSHRLSSGSLRLSGHVLGLPSAVLLHCCVLRGDRSTGRVPVGSRRKSG